MSPWLKAPPRSPSAAGAGAANDADAAASVSASAQQQSQRYHLSAVVMHVGGPSAGHYYAYVRYVAKPPPSMSSPPSGSTELGNEPGGTRLPQQDAAKQDAKWVKLDDQRVTEVSEAEVLRDAFGGSGGVYGGPAASGVAGFQGLLGMVRESRCLHKLEYGKKRARQTLRFAGNPGPFRTNSYIQYQYWYARRT